MRGRHSKRLKDLDPSTWRVQSNMFFCMTCMIKYFS